jgi:GntP family gluconate:H+ symporter
MTGFFYSGNKVIFKAINAVPMSLLTGLSLVLAGIILIILMTSWLKVNAFLSLFMVSFFLAIAVLPIQDVVPVLKKGFGDTMASIGLIIVFGAIIGVVLDTTGATLSMANFILGKTGKDRAPLAISITGFITGLPIFCDSGFVVLSGLNRSLTLKSKSNPVFMATALATSLYAVHCLIPPHPGATAAAGILDAPIGKAVLLGIMVAIPAAIAGYSWAKLASRRFSLKTEPLRQAAPVTIPHELPAPGKSFLPVLVPLALITMKSLINFLVAENTLPVRIIGLLGDPVIALMTGMMLSFRLFPAFHRDSLNRVINASIEKAGPIIIITAAGGIFGAVIKATGTGEQVGTMLAGTGLGLLIPFLITFILKTAQGSSTVAIITAASIAGPMLGSLGFTGEADKILVLLAMGAGSMMISHANDSYFWVVTNFSGIASDDTLKIYSTATIVMGLAAMACIMVLSLVLG